MPDVTPDSFAALEKDVLACRLCPRLAEWREQVAAQKRRAYQDWTYWGRPVPGFGDPLAAVLVVGLAPGAHGSNRTGRMFTGDASGDFLYPALHRAGFASQPNASSKDDGLRLKGLYITAVCRCAPPGNKPSLDEMRACKPFLLREVALLSRLAGVVALGRIAYDAVIDIFGVKPGQVFSHGRLITPGEGKPWIIASYHPSRQNTQTGRLTTDMFDRVWQKARGLVTEEDEL